MDVLHKITQLREERKWSEAQLADRAGMTQSTISSWYRRNMTPSVGSLSKVCKAFGITLSQFFMDEGGSSLCLSDTQKQLLHSAEKLDQEQYEALLHFLRTL